MNITKRRSLFFDEFFKGLKALCDKTCEQEFKATVASPSFEEVSQLFCSDMHYLRHGKGKLSKFWMSNVDMVETLLSLLRDLGKETGPSPLIYQYKEVVGLHDFYFMPKCCLFQYSFFLLLGRLCSGRFYIFTEQMCF